MRTKLLVVLTVVAAAVVLAACGSSKKSSSSSTSAPSSTPPPTTSTTAKKSKKKKTSGLPSRTYKLKLAGKVEVPKGAPAGGGDAVVSIHGKTDQACWRFSHLHGFTSATFAHIHQGVAGKAGNIVVPLSTGAALKHAGCVKASPTLLKNIEANPHGYYVNIHSKKYPAGAVRSQL